MKMKTVIIAALLIGSVLLLCLQADTRRLILDEVKRVRGETDVKPSLVPAKSGLNGDGIIADQVNTSSEEKKTESDEDEASSGQGTSGDSTHHMFPDQPPLHGH